MRTRWPEPGVTSEHEIVKYYLDIAVSMFPHIQIRHDARHPIRIHMLGKAYTYYMYVKDEGLTGQYFRNLGNSLKSYINTAMRLPEDAANDFFQESCAIRWLETFNPKINWKKIISYLRLAEYRTYENSKTLYNFIIRDGSGKAEINDKNIFKLLDQLGSSLNTYIEADPEFRFVDICEIKWDEIDIVRRSSIYPSFMHPLLSATADGNILITRTSKGDILVCSSRQLIAAKRHGYWKLYDGDSLQKSITSIMHDYTPYDSDNVSSDNILPILYDLSFKRHGALLIYDPQELVTDFISNRSSIVGNSGSLDIRRHIERKACSKSPASCEISTSNHRIVCELASIDGAITFNNKSITSFGSFIEPHRNANEDLGTRSTAASSAFYYGALPFKVSSDGDVTVIHARNKNSQEKVTVEIM